ncbi:RHS repeat-associated core domain-containing protein [Cryocola sp. 340MFSha3.1]|uniref:RHS repeat protein n=1 Tax=Cryocola sp. 340MFSha3.1 TaxID=1169145 RepID=UPI00035FD70C|nr:RHS repeat-associated core domain-containing protein [Cryocola sp. 340MFSha3.1]
MKDSGGVTGFVYDEDGRMTTPVDQQGGRLSTAYDKAGQTTQVTLPTGQKLAYTYGYDGLGRRTTATEETRYGTSTTRTSFDGLDPVQSTTAGAGTTTLIRDAVGALAEHVTANGTATWDLLDRLGSTVAGATGGSITQLSSYDDWGDQRFETTGWSAPENFTGETTDPTQGRNHYYARAYDPSAASWTSQDPWHGTTDEPRSQHRYGYAWNNPTSNLDIDGNLCARVNPKSDALPVGCGATPVQAHTNVADRSKPPVAPQPPRTEQTPKKPAPADPASKSNTTDRHDINWELIGTIFGVISGVAGLFFWVPYAGPVFAAISAAAGLVSTAISCLNAFESPTAPNWADCIIGAILTAIPFIPLVLKNWIRGMVLDMVRGAVQAIGSSGSGLAVGQNGGKLIGKGTGS